MNYLVSFTLWMAVGIPVVAGLLFVGLALNVLLFPEMWQQDDVPKAIRYFAEGRRGL